MQQALYYDSNPFRFSLREDVYVDETREHIATIVARCETFDPHTQTEVAFYLVEDGENEWEITQDSLLAYNMQECNHKWSFYEADKALNICVRCSKKKKIAECN